MECLDGNAIHGSRPVREPAHAEHTHGPIVAQRRGGLISEAPCIFSDRLPAHYAPRPTRRCDFKVR
eukprot:3422113-Pyramimonas_sp.AAC.1